MALVRVYHPETNEPFDVTESIATKLRLQEGWLSHAFEEVKAEVEKIEEAIEAEVEEIVDAVEKIANRKKS